LLVKSGGDAAVPEWQAGFRAVAPDLEVRGWSDPSVDPAEVAYVLVWEPEPGRIAGYPNLRVIFSSAAGVDHIVRDPTVPAHLPIVRMVSEETSQTLGEYCCLAALSILRDYPRMIAAQAERRWDTFEPPHTAWDKCVGIMGFGTIGQVAARMLGGVGRAWRRHVRRRRRAGVVPGAVRHPGEPAARYARDPRSAGCKTPGTAAAWCRRGERWSWHGNRAA
jgi:glyoxylate/hydroxypyruvate reductase A